MRNTVSGVVDAVVQAGVRGGVHVRAGAEVFSRYVHQVRRIAPSTLVGRDAELAKLSAFCLMPDTAC